MRAILTYHSIDPSGSPISLDEITLRRHVGWLASGRVAVLPLEQILRAPPDGDAVAVTFDDGFVNFADVAWPLLEQRALPATLFVASGRVGSNNAWDGAPARGIPTLPLLGWNALARLVERGLALGSHSRTHAHLTQVSDAQLDDELAGSAGDIQRVVGVRPRHFCYPYGDADERVVATVAKHYELACTTELAVLAPRAEPHRLPRLDMHYYRGAGRLEAWGTGAFKRHLWLRACARRVRAGLTG